jgi:hypothetical protein
MSMHNLGDIWERLFPVERIRIVGLMVAQVQLVSGGLKIRWNPLGWQELLGEFSNHPIGAELVEMETQA